MRRLTQALIAVFVTTAAVVMIAAPAQAVTYHWMSCNNSGGLGATSTYADSLPGGTMTRPHVIRNNSPYWRTFHNTRWTSSSGWVNWGSPIHLAPNGAYTLDPNLFVYTNWNYWRTNWWTLPSGGQFLGNCWGPSV